MSKELMRLNEPTSKVVGASLAKTGGAGLALGAVAWMLPFITLPMLLVVAVLTGVMLYVKSDH